MKYISTRSNYSCNSLQAVLSGISPDGGLFISPEILSSPFDWKSVIGKPTLEMALLILSHLLPDFNDMEDLVQKAYRGKFETEDLTPLVKVGDKYVLELFRGPTSAFKDVALSMLPQLITAAKKQTGDKNETVILTATSGDTGKAALEGFHDVPGTRIIVFYPDGGVSPIQRAQMVTQEGSNVRVCAVRGNFDDCQTAVKQTFAKVNAMEELKNAGKTLSSANSINIGRLAPQVVYYFKAYSDLVGENRISLGDQIDFVVPSGNFGDILAGYFAKLMGLPVRHLICASNENRVLTDFLTTGLYDRQRPFYRTSSPSMDILVSSNLERLLFLACGCDAEQVRSWMSDLSSKGSFKVQASVL
ncbi:MAG: threonine synthase, partial [Spirochaetales bacterium]|nr:threonine synthase [Spirochaetales bacterium]